MLSFLFFFFLSLTMPKKNFQKRKGRVDCALALWLRFRLCWHALWKLDARFSRRRIWTYSPVRSVASPQISFVLRRVKIFVCVVARLFCLVHSAFVRIACRTWQKLTGVISCRFTRSTAFWFATRILLSSQLETTVFLVSELLLFCFCLGSSTHFFSSVEL